MKATLFRYRRTNKRTLGVLFVGEDMFHTLEPPWVDNIKNVSSIPPGNYTAHFMERSSSGKYKKVFWIKPVKDRSGILIHSGNTVNHTKGCILLGERIGTLLNQSAVLNSRTAMRKIQKYKDSFDLEIR